MDYMDEQHQPLPPTCTHTPLNAHIHGNEHKYTCTQTSELEKKLKYEQKEGKGEGWK